MSDISIEACSEQEFAKRFPNEDADIKKMLGLNYVPKLFRTVVTLSPSLAVSSWQMVRGILCNGKLSRVLKEMIFLRSLTHVIANIVQLHIRLWH